jgi:hypothetical protein
MALLAVVLIVAVIFAIVIGAAAFSESRQLPPGPSEPTAIAPPQELRFQKRLLPPESPRFKKRIPPPPPATRTLKPTRTSGGGAIEVKKLHIDFNRPCRVTGRPMRECGCQSCRDLRKKYGV